MKADGSIRITIDYKKLNDACVKDVYPIPHMESLYTKLTHSKFNTKIDCFNGLSNTNGSRNKPSYVFWV